MGGYVAELGCSCLLSCVYLRCRVLERIDCLHKSNGVPTSIINSTRLNLMSRYPRLPVGEFTYEICFQVLFMTLQSFIRLYFSVYFDIRIVCKFTNDSGISALVRRFPSVWDRNGQIGPTRNGPFFPRNCSVRVTFQLSRAGNYKSGCALNSGIADVGQSTGHLVLDFTDLN